MIKAFKTEVKLSPTQIQRFHQSVGICRYLYNLYLATNKQLYTDNQADPINNPVKFISQMTFDKWVNNEHSLENPWIKLCHSKSRKYSVKCGETAFTNFFKKRSKFPKFKKKADNSVKLYFYKDSPTACQVERHRLTVPGFGYIHLKEKGYLPTDCKVINGYISQHAGRYYVSITTDVTVNPLTQFNDGIGIDLGIKEFAFLSTGKSYPNLSKAIKIKKLRKQIKTKQRSLSRKLTNKKKDITCKGKNFNKNKLQIQKLNKRITDITNNQVNQFVNDVVKSKPQFVTIENLNVKGLMKNRHLSKAIAQMNWFSTRTKLTNKCKDLGIELRVVSRFYPSSKLCSCCNNVKKDLKLKDRIYECMECGLVIDRDLNAGFNLKRAVEYSTA